MNRQQQRLARAHVRGTFLWEVREHFPGANLLYAQLDGRQFSKAQATKITRDIADVLRTSLELHRLPIKNPTLVHHGWIRKADWHVLEDPGGDSAPLPLADLYSMNEAVAMKVAQALASGLHRPVMLMDNKNMPASIAQHPMSEVKPLGRVQRRLNPSRRPRVGEVWHGLRGDRCRILSVSANRVTVLQLDTGHRVTSEIHDFLASYKPPGGPQANQRRLNFPTVAAETLKVGDVVMPPEREVRLWMARDAAEKGMSVSDLGIMLTDVHEGEPDKRGRWVWFSGYLKDQWYQGRKPTLFKFKARPGTPWPVAARPTRENPSRSSGARARRTTRRRTLRSQAQAIGGRRVVRALSRGQTRRAQHYALQSKYRYRRLHPPVPSSNQRRRNVRYVRTLSPLAERKALAFEAEQTTQVGAGLKKPEVVARARVLLDAYLRGALQGGQTVSLEEVKSVWLTSLIHAAAEVVRGRVRNPKGPKTRRYKTENSFRKALAKFKTSGELVDWYGDDHGWVIRLKTIVPSGRPNRRQYRHIRRVGTRAKHNPRRGSELARARASSKMWHEFPASRVHRVKGDPQLKRKTLVGLGELVKVDYRSNKYTGRMATYTHSFKRPRPILATDPDAQHLHIVSGKVKITADGLEN